MWTVIDGSAPFESRSSHFEAGVKPRPGSRSFRLGFVTWCVYEDRHPFFGASLIFDSDRIARRVRSYPPNWRELTDEQLAELSLSR